MSFWGLNNFYMPVMPSFTPTTSLFMPSIPELPAYNPFMSNMLPPFPPYAINNYLLNPFGGFNDTSFFAYNPLNIFSQGLTQYTPLMDFSPTPAAPSDNIFGFLNSQYVTNDIKTNIDVTKNSAKLPALTTAGYNRQKGEKLARLMGSRSTDGGFDNYCARNVKEAIEDAGLGRYESGHGYQMADILCRNRNFKEISAQNLDLSTLPAGCVLVYDRGVAGYSSQYGHTEITLGDGTAGSGGITHNIRQGARVFVPV